MIRAVLGTNTIVSGLGWGGPPGAVLDAALAGHFDLVTSPTLLDELRRVLAYPKLQAVIGDANELIEFVALTAIVVTPTETVELVRDPDDDRLIEAALAAHADVIDTGDQDLLTLGHVDQIQILTPRAFLEALPPSTQLRHTGRSNHGRKRPWRQPHINHGFRAASSTG